MRDNLVRQARPTSQFSTYQPQTDSQAEALKRFTALADAIARKSRSVVENTYPFEHGRIIFVSGNPGVGKTHLVEALINELTQREPDLVERIFLFRGNFTHANIANFSDFGGCPIVIIDDLFAERQSIEKLHPNVEIKVLMQLITAVYDERRLVLVTSNFPLMQGIVEKILAADAVGRVSSRLRELMANSGELIIEGRDYREILAEGRTADDLFGEI